MEDSPGKFRELVRWGAVEGEAAHTPPQRAQRMCPSPVAPRHLQGPLYLPKIRRPAFPGNAVSHPPGG